MKKSLFLLGMLLASVAGFSQQASLNGVVATTVGQSVAAPNTGAIYQFTIGFTGAGPTAQTTLIQGSLDNTHWYTLYTSTSIAYTSDLASGEAVSVVNMGFPFLRCNLTVYTQGSNTGETCTIASFRL